MAGIVNEAYTLDVNVQEGGAAEASVNVRSWNQAGTSVLDKTTDAQGDITSTILIAREHSITLTSTRATTEFNPFQLRALKWVTPVVLNVLNVSINLVAPSKQTLFTTANGNVVQTNQTTVQGYTGETYSHGTDTVTHDGTGGTPIDTMDEFYDSSQNEAITVEQVTPPQPLSTIDGQNYVLEYDWVIDGVSFNGQNRAVAMATGKDVTIQGVGGNLTDITITGDVNLGTGTGGVSLDNLDVSGALDFSIAGTYALTDCQIGEVTNSSGGAVTINAVGDTTITTNTGPNITINNAVPVKATCIDNDTKLPVEGVRVRIEEDPGGTEILNELTDVNGVAQTTFNYLSDQDITGDARKGTSPPVYKAAPITGTITSAGFDVTISLNPDA